MTDVLGAVIRGLSFGSVYALLAVGLVLTFRTTGVFNLAFGPQAFFAAALFYDTHTTHHWPLIPALLFSVAFMAPIVGFVLDRGLFRFLRTASETARLVSVLGLFVALPQMIFLWFGENAKSNGSGIVPDGSIAYSPIHNVFVSRDDLAIIITGVVVIIGLSALLKYTAIGLRMRRLSCISRPDDPSASPTGLTASTRASTAGLTPHRKPVRLCRRPPGGLGVAGCRRHMVVEWRRRPDFYFLRAVNLLTEFAGNAAQK